MLPGLSSRTLTDASGRPEHCFSNANLGKNPEIKACYNKKLTN